MKNQNDKNKINNETNKIKQWWKQTKCPKQLITEFIMLDIIRPMSI